MDKTLVVTDLDGTLWDTTMVCRQRTLDAVRSLEAADIGLLVATGRRAESARRSLEANRLVLPSVLLNGALGVDFTTGDTFHQHIYEPGAVSLALEIFGAHGLSPCLHASDGLMHVSQAPSTSQRHVASVAVDVRRHDDLTAAAREQSVFGMSILGIQHGRVAGAAKALVASGAGEVALYVDQLFEGWSLMVQPAGISKWRGIEAWFDHSDTRPDRVIAMGDGGNDLEMLEAADVAVAVVGADARVLELADVIIDTPDNGGWAEVLELL